MPVPSTASFPLAVCHSLGLRLICWLYADRGSTCGISAEYSDGTVSVSLFSACSLGWWQSLAANVENISRSRGFKKIIGGLREKEKNFANHGSDGVR